MNELFLIAACAVSTFAIFFGHWQANNLWLLKAGCHSRKECRGKLYWVVEDGDLKKLYHIRECFKAEK